MSTVPTLPGITSTMTKTKRINTRGSYREVVIADAAHSPHIEKPDEFMAALLAFLKEDN